MHSNNSNKSKQIFQAEQLIIQTLKIHSILEVDEDEVAEDHAADELISTGYEEDHFSAPIPQPTSEDLEALEILGQQEKQDRGSQAMPSTLSTEESEKILEDETAALYNLDSFLGEEKDSQAHAHLPTKLRRNKSHRQLTSYVDSTPDPAILAECFLEVNPRLESFILKLKEENSQLKQAIQWTQKELEQLSLKLVELQKELSCSAADEDEFILVRLPARTVEWQKLELDQPLSVLCGSIEKEDLSVANYSIEDTNINRVLTPEFLLSSRGNSPRENFLSQDANTQAHILEDLTSDNSQLTAQVQALKMQNQNLEKTLSETRALDKAYQGLGKPQQLLLAGETIEEVPEVEEKVEAGLNLCNLSGFKPLLELRDITVKCEPILKEDVNSRGK